MYIAPLCYVIIYLFITQREHLRVVAREKRKDPSPSNLDRFAKAVEDLNSAYEREQM